MLKLSRMLLLAFSFTAFLTGCVTTALYGAKFEPVGEDTFNLQIAFGGLPITPPQDIEAATRKVLEQEAQKFIEITPEYSSWQVLSYHRKFIPSAIVYSVKFTRKD